MMLPPANGHAAENVGNGDADQGINSIGMSDRQMTGIVGRERQLMPKCPEKHGREIVVPWTGRSMKEINGKEGQKQISETFSSIIRVVTVEKA